MTRDPARDGRPSTVQPDADFPTDDRRQDDRGTNLAGRGRHAEPPSAKAGLHGEMPGPTGRATTTELVGAARVPETTGGPDGNPSTNEDGPLQVPGSEGTGPVDPATDYVRD